MGFDLPMFRLALTIGSLAMAIGLGGCGAPEANAIDVDIPVGDQCFHTLDRRPTDCYARAPCMWSDADLSVRESRHGVFSLQAGSGGWETRSAHAERSTQASGNSPEALARQLPQILARLHEAPPAVSHSCVYLRADQNLRFGDVIALHRALTAQGVRRVGIVATLVDDPLRFAQITFRARNDAAFIQQMRNYASANGFAFSQQPWEVETESRFQILGNGVNIVGERVDAPVDDSAFSVMLELSPQSDGTLPTEQMMDQLFGTFAAAVARVGGAAVTVEQTSRR